MQLCDWESTGQILAQDSEGAKKIHCRLGHIHPHSL